MNYPRILLRIATAALLASGGTALAQVTDSLRESSQAFASIANSVSPSVASVSVVGLIDAPSSGPFQSPFDDEFFRRFFGDIFPETPDQNTYPNQRRVIGQGSAFVYRVEDRFRGDVTYLLTNSHVVENAEDITVTFPDGREFGGTVKGSDPKSDVAVIEIETADIPALRFGDSDEIEVGEWVVAIGNPFGLSHTLTVGVVSAKGRTSIGINDYEDFIQTDAAINPGNSGGPLLNLDGEVIGMNTAIFSQSGGYMGIGFAIPSDLVQGIAEQLIASGSVTRGQLGIIIQPLTTELAESFEFEGDEGILVAQVNPGSPAANAGMQAGDIITEFAGEPIAEIGDFRNKVALTAPGSRRELNVIRDGEELELAIIVGEQPVEPQRGQDDSNSAQELGLTVNPITSEIGERLGVDPSIGVVVTDVAPGSIGAMAGIQPMTIILEVNQREISGPQEFQREIAAAQPDRRALLLIIAEGVQRYIALRW